MTEIATIGVDLAKSVFQAHGSDAEGAVVLRRQLRRNRMLEFLQWLAPCLIGMKACAGAYHWARELARLGHDLRLMPPSCVKPYARRGKTDRADSGGDLQSRHPAVDALRAGEERGDPGPPDVPQGPGIPGPPADAAAPGPDSSSKPGTGSMH